MNMPLWFVALVIAIGDVIHWGWHEWANNPREAACDGLVLVILALAIWLGAKTPTRRAKQ